MRNSRDFMQAMCAGIAGLMFVATAVWAVPPPGISITVKIKSAGLPGSAVAANPDPENDVYSAGAGTNLLRLPYTLLGLQ